MPQQFPERQPDLLDQFEEIDIVRHNDLPAFQRTGNEFYDKQRATMRQSLQQGLARGVITEEQALKAWEDDDRNWVEKLFGFEASGSRVMQPLIDILLLGNYATASLSKARTQYLIEHKNSEDLWESIGAWTVGFSPAEFTESFKERTTFRDVLGWEDAGMGDPRFWGALALDIFLDPVTYLTFGAKPGIQVLARSGAKQHTTRWGTEIWKEAARKLHPELWEKVVKDNAFLTRAGEAPKAWGSTQRLLEFRDQVGAYMIDNYSQLAEEAAKRLGQSKLSGFAGKAERGVLGLPPSSAMFQETAGILRKERGLWTAGKIERMLSSVSAKANPLDDFFRKFNQTWGMSEEAKAAYSVIRSSISHQKREAQKRIAQLFKDTSEDERRAITHFMETLDNADAGVRNSVASVPQEWSPKLQALAAAVRKEFDDIALQEQRAGILGEGLEDYVTHIFNDPKVVAPVMQLAKRMGFKGGQKNSFSMQRALSSVMQANELFGKDVMLDDIAQILWHRKRTSVDMLGKQRLQTHFKVLYGVADINFPKEITKFLKANRRDAEIISDLDQVWQLPEFDIAKFGFKQGDAGHNRQVMRWITEGSREEIPKFLTESSGKLPQFIGETGNITPSFSGTIKGGGFELHINDLLDYIYMGTPLADGKVNKTAMAALMRSADKLTRKKMGAPMLAVFDDIEKLLRKQYPGRGKRDNFNKLFEKLGAPIEGLKHEAVLPEELILNARMFRQMAGDITDTLPFDGTHLANTLKRLGETGLKPGEIDQVLDAMFKKKGLKNLTAREGSIFEDWLVRQFGYKADMYGARLDGEAIVRVGFPKSKHVPETTFTRVNEALAERHLAASRDINSLTSQYNKLRRQASDLSVNINAIAKSKTGRSVIELVENNPEYIALDEAYVAARSAHRDITGELKSAREQLRAIYKKYKKGGIKNAAKKRAAETKELRARISELGAERAPAYQAARKAQEAFINKRTQLNEALKAQLGDEYSKLKESYDALKSTTTGVRDSRKVAKAARQLINAEKRLASLQNAQLLGEDVTKKIQRAKDKIKELGGKVQEDVATVTDDLPLLQRPDLRDITARAAEDIGPTFSRVKAPHWVEATEWYLPKSIAALLHDIHQPLYREETRYLMRGYDLVQQFFKAPLMAPFAEFYKRNAITNIALISLRTGLSMLNPRHSHDFLKVLSYHLASNGVDAAQTLKSSVAIGGTIGGVSGAVAGASAAYHEGESVDGYAKRIAKGAGAGAAMGAGFVGGTAAVGLAGVRGVAHVGVRKAGGLDALANKVITLRGGAQYTVKEMLEQASKRGVFNTYVSNELFAGMSVGRSAKETAKQTASEVIHMRDLFRLGELASEIPTRLMLFMTVAKESGSLHTAGKAVREYLFDYSKLSTFERRVMRRAIPFYTWVKHALTVSYDTIVKHPGRLGAQFKFVRNQNKYADIDPADKPDWLAEKLSLLSLNDETGEVNIRTNLGLAHEDAVDIVKNLTGGPEHWKKLLSRGPFGLTTALELTFNIDTFKGGVILPTMDQDSDFESARPFRNSPDWLRAAVGFRIKEDGREVVDPRFAYMMREVPYSRFINITRQIYDVKDEGTVAERRKLNYFSLARSVLGEKLYKYDPESNRAWHDKERLDRMAQFLKKLGMIYEMKIYGSTTKSPSQRGRGQSVKFNEPSNTF